mmetsp:Transcript_50378/g.164619  ORF Transcript_50378/g.164619 Transcript_50378/m.164619 type:complete len:232 (+) Transcript_50378:107-802(+)
MRGRPEADVQMCRTTTHTHQKIHTHGTQQQRGTTWAGARPRRWSVASAVRRAEDCGAGGGRATMWSVRLSCTHPNVAAVVGVNHAGARVDEVLPGEAGAGRDAAIAALRHDHRQVRLDESLAARGHDAGVRGREVVASGERRAAHRQLGVLGEPLHDEAAGRLEARQLGGGAVQRPGRRDDAAKHFVHVKSGLPPDASMHGSGEQSKGRERVMPPCEPARRVCAAMKTRRV